MELDFSQEEPKLILAYPHKPKLEIIYILSMVSSFLIFMSVFNYLESYETDFADKISIVVSLIYIIIFLCFFGYYHFINAVKLEIYENNAAKYYVPGGRGHSALHFKFNLEDIEQIKIKKRPFDYLKLTIKIRNPVFYGFYEKKLNKPRNVNIITDRKNSEIFMRHMEKFRKKNNMEEK